MGERAEVGMIALRFGRDRGALPPLGPLLLGGALDRHAIGWTLDDSQRCPDLGPFALDAFVAMLRRIEAPIWGLSVFNDALPLVIAALPHAAAGRRVFVGGPGTLGLADALLAAAPEIEAVVTGEADAVFPELVRARPGSPALPGVVGRTTALRRPAAVVEPAQLPAPAWRWCRGRGYSVVPLSTMRGCPFACQFCEVEALAGRRVRRQDLATALGDLRRALDAIATHRVQVLDDAFTLGKGHLLEFCRALVDRRWGVEFEIFARPNTLDDESCEALAAAGCRRAYMGIDAGCDDLLRRVTRGLTVSDALAGIDRAARWFEVVVSTMWGYPFESLAQLDAALRLGRRLRDRGFAHPVRLELHRLQPSVATPLFAEHHDRLVLLEQVADRPAARDERAVLDVIGRDRRIGAAFYRYETADHARKCRLLETYQEEVACPA